VSLGQDDLKCRITSREATRMFQKLESFSLAWKEEGERWPPASASPP
jgi:hypothetical protein